MEKDKEFQWVSDSNKTDKYQGVAAPKEDKSEDFGKLKWKVGQILAEQFLKYNDGKFIAAIELNPATHALTEFIESENTALREALKELLPIAQWGYDLLVPFDKKGMGREWPAIIERVRKSISK